MSRKRWRLRLFRKSQWLSVCGITTITFFIAYILTSLTLAIVNTPFKRQHDAVRLRHRTKIRSLTQIKTQPLPIVKPETFITIKNILGKTVKIRVPERVVRDYNKTAHSKEGHKSLYSAERLPPISHSNLLLPGSEDEVLTKKLLALRHIKVINTCNAVYNIDPFGACSHETVDLLVVVTIPIYRNDVRQAFRKNMWGGYGSKLNKIDGQNVVILFFVGKSTNEKYQNMLQTESEMYGDIVQGSFGDTHANQSIKATFALKWITLRCPSARFVVMASENCLVNVPLMLTELRLQRSETSLFILGKAAALFPPAGKNCQGSKRTKAPRGWRDGKYATALREVQFLEKGCVGFPTSMAKLLYEASFRVPQIPYEHIFLTGICASLLNVPLYDNKAFYFGPARITDMKVKQVINQFHRNRPPQPG